MVGEGGRAGPAEGWFLLTGLYNYLAPALMYRYTVNENKTIQLVTGRVTNPSVLTWGQCPPSHLQPCFSLDNSLHAVILAVISDPACATMSFLET